jgi:hypothetical protein
MAIDEERKAVDTLRTLPGDDVRQILSRFADRPRNAHREKPHGNR